MPVNATATELRDCLQTMRTIGEIEVFTEPHAYGLAWVVRFYAEGDPASVFASPGMSQKRPFTECLSKEPEGSPRRPH